MVKNYKCLKKLSLFLVFVQFVIPFFSVAQEGKPIGPKPTIEKIKPESGSPGAQVEIIGKNFSPDYSVWLGTIQVEVLSVTIDKITVKVPVNAKTGRFVLKGKYIVESPTLFTVVESRPSPLIYGFVPSSGAPGTIVKISGANFSSQIFENSVMLGNSQVQIQSAAPGELVVVIPKEATSGKFTVTVMGGGTVISNQIFTVQSPLVVTDFSPKFGPPGTEVTIFGSGFGDKKFLSVTMGGKITKLKNVLQDRVVIEIPQDAISSPLIVNYKGEPKASTIQSFEVRIPPVIESFEPIEGFPGTIVTIRGKNFGSSELKAKVKLGSILVKILSITDEKIEVQIPQDGQSNPLTVEVTGKGEATTARAFSVWAPLIISSFAPEKGEAGTVVKISGQGFIPDLKKVSVFLGTVPLEITGITSTEISVKIPQGAPSQKFTVSVKDRGKVESAKAFLVVELPVIEKFYPVSGQIGQMVTVTGKNFGFSTDNIRVWIGPPDRKQFCIVQQIAGTKLTCQVQPNTVSGPVTIAVKDMGETVSTSIFQIEEPLTVAGFSPTSGLPGTMVTINGTGFSPVKNLNSVKLGKIPLKILSSDSNSIVVQIPVNIKTGGNFIVSVKGKQSSAVSASAFNLILPVKIKSITPKAGPIGTTVKITGQGFGTNLQMVQVLFLGFYCPVISLTPEEIQVQVPPGLMPGVSQGKFQVIVNPGGIDESPQIFKVTQAHPKTKAIPKE